MERHMEPDMEFHQTTYGICPFLSMERHMEPDMEFYYKEIVNA